MRGPAYYNENDSAAAAILREQIRLGVIAPGDVDERSIKEVTADDIRGYIQCHWFAGGGLWSVAARMAGWPDNRPLWSASCPCQPFSAAGKGAGTDDPRHLWPDLLRILRGARADGNGPPVIVGEQVSGAPGHGWFDGVSADLAEEGLASRSRDFPACALDAPHQRNRLYWVAVANSEILGGGARLREGGSIKHGTIAANRNGICGQVVITSRIGRGEGRPEHDLQRGRPAAASADVRGGSGGMGDADGALRQGQPDARRFASGAPRRTDAQRADCRDGGYGDMGHASRRGWQSERQSEAHLREAWSGEDRGSDGRNGTHWSDAEWIICHDGKARRAEPSVRLLVNGLPGRVDLWRVGGNAIVPQAAAEVIAAFLEAEAAYFAPVASPALPQRRA